MAGALLAAGHSAMIVDDRWNLVYVTDELRLTFGAYIERAPFAIGRYSLGEEAALVARTGGSA